MRKVATTIYLTMDQDARLKEAQRRTGLSMAELVRQGVDLILERYQSYGVAEEAEDQAPIRVGRAFRKG